MDMPITKEDCKQTFRRANKILNLWIEQKLPFTNRHLLQEKYQEYEVMRKKDERIAAEFQLEKKDASPEQIEFAVDMQNALYQIRLEAKPQPERFKKKSTVTSMSGREYLELRLKDIRENTKLTPEEKLAETDALSDQIIKWITTSERQGGLHTPRVDKVITGGDAFMPYNMFNLYLYPDDKHDNDIEIDIHDLKLEQKKVLKQIKNIIKNLSSYDLKELSNLDKLFLKIISILNYSQFELNHELDFEVLENWAKIGLWLIDRSYQPSKKNWEKTLLKPIKQYIQKGMTPLVALIYSQLAFFLCMSNKLEKIFSENLLEIAHSLQEKFVATPQTHQTIQLVNTICQCTQAKIFLDNHQVTLFTTTLTQILQSNHRYSTSLFRILYLAGKYFCESNPDNTRMYFEQALNLLNDANMREKSLEQNDDKEMQAFLAAHQTKKRIELQQEITKIFPFCGVGITSEKLNIFLYLDEVPKGEIALPFNSPITNLKKYDNAPHKDKILMGFRFYTASIEIQAVIRAIHKLVQQIEKTLNFEQAQLAKKVQQLTLQSKPLFCTNALEPSKVLACPQQQQPKRVAPKNKTRVAHPSKGGTTQTTVSTIFSTIKKRASEYGFKMGADNLIAPIYFSKVHKERGNPQIVACWDDHKCLNLDSELVRKFKGLFDPAGVVQARKVNEPGFKIIAGPNNQWIVRGKLEGEGRSTRIYFKPIETIVTDGGEEITLYKLKKKINK